MFDFTVRHLHLTLNVSEASVRSIVNAISNLGVTMATQAQQIRDDLAAISATLDNVKTDTTSLLDKIAELEEAVQNGADLSEIATLVTAVKEQATGIDEMVQASTPEEPQP